MAEFTPPPSDTKEAGIANAMMGNTRTSSARSMINKLAEERRGKADVGVARAEWKPPSYDSSRLLYAGEEQPPMQSEWNYLTPPISEDGRQLGMNNETLPPGAEGWDPYGRPYWGDGLRGWLNKSAYNINRTPDETAIYQAQEEEGTVARAFEEITKVLPSYFANASWGGEEGEKNIFNTAARYLGVGVDAVMQAAEGVTEATEQAVNVPYMLAAEADYGQLPEKVEYDRPEWSERVSEFAAIAGNMVLAPWWTVQAIKASHDGALQEDSLLRAWQASGMAYTAYTDVAVREEFYRRVRAGEDPNLLAMELEDPMLEMAGRIVFDPLNLFDLLGAGTKAQRSRQYASAADEFSATGKVLDALKDIENITDYGDQVSRVERVVEGAVDAMNDTRTAISRFANDRRITALTAEGKRFDVSRRVTEVAYTIAHNTDPDEAVEIYKALAVLAGGDVDEAVVAVDTLLSAQTGSKILFSEAANQLGVVMRSLLMDGDNMNGKALERILTADLPRDDIVKNLMEFFDSRAGKAIDGMFPTVQEMSRARTLARAGDKTEEVARLAAMGEEINPVIRAIGSWDKVIKSKAYAPLNRFFASVYMGMSPGYAMRNYISNSLHILMDYGPEPFFTGPTKALDNIQSWLGYTPSGVSGFGAAHAAEVSDSKSFFNYFLRKSEQFETNGATIVMNHVIERTMTESIQSGRAIPDMAPMIEAGLSPQMGEYLQTMLLKNKGNVAQTMADFKTAFQTGSVDLYSAGTWMSAENLREMNNLPGLRDDMFKIISSDSTLDEQIEAVNELAKRFQDVADDVNGEIPQLTEDVFGYKSAISLTHADEISDGASAVIQSQRVANGNSIADWQAVGDQAERMAIDSLVRGGMSGEEATITVRQFIGGRLDEARMGTDRAKTMVDQVMARAWEVNRDLKSQSGVDWGAAWDKHLGNRLPKPDGVSRDMFFDAWWDSWTRPEQKRIMALARDVQAQGINNVLVDLMKQFGIEEGGLIANARLSLRHAQDLDNAIHDGDRLLGLAGMGRIDDATISVRTIGAHYGIPSVTDAGVYDTGAGNHLLNAINKWRRENGLDEFAHLNDVDDVSAIQALKARGEAAVEAVDGMAAAQVVPPPYTRGTAPSMARVMHEGNARRNALFGDIQKAMNQNFGSTSPMVGTEDFMGHLDTWGALAHERMAEMKLLASNTANQARDFTMLSYPGKRNFDAIAAYIYPYSFWHSRTYAHWLQRVGQNPGMIAAYSNYKQGLAKVHADQPEWYRYNLNTNMLPGLDSENPLFFNLEATLNPLNGITGIDFNDPYKRVDGFSRMLSDANKLGPSTWSPLNYAMAIMMAVKGEEEAMSRWGSRLIPQTATLKAVTSLFDIERPEGFAGRFITPAGVEIDPAVHMFSGGIGPYERRRVGRALGALADNGTYTDEEIIDAANAQQGPVWDHAMQNAARQRAPGQIMSFMGGPGFQARTTTDVSIDRMYTEYYALWRQDDNLSPEEVRTSMENLRQRYPFMDAVLLSRKGGVLRDRAYAYNVLSRIPPSQSREFAESVGLPPELMSQFYDDKGHIENWEESEQQRFMAGITDLGAALALPDHVTRVDWNRARNAYTDMQKIAEDRWGDSLMDEVGVYFGMRGDTQEEKDRANAFLEAHPDVSEYLDWKAQAVSSTPQLASYYGGIEQIEGYWKGVMWNEIEENLGEDIWDTWDEYWTLKEAGGDFRSFWNSHPELDEYGDMKDEWGNIINEQMIAFGSRLQEPMPATTRDTEGATVGQRAALETAQQMAQPQEIPPEVLEEALTNYGGREFWRVVRDTEDMPDTAWDMLLAFSESIGVEPDYILSQIR